MDYGRGQRVHMGRMSIAHWVTNGLGKGAKGPHGEDVYCTSVDFCSTSVTCVFAMTSQLLVVVP
jgi:hypothetical protein